MDKTDELTDLRVQTHVWETIQIRMKEESRYEAEGISTAIDKECTRLSTDTWWELQPSPAKICWVQWILWLGESSDSALCADPEENDFPGDRYQLMKLIISRQAHVLDNNKGKGKATMQTSVPSATSSRDSQSTGENPNGNIVPGNENKKAASPSKSNAQFDHITRSFAGINLNQGSTSQSYAGAAREGAKLPDAEDEMAAHWKIVQANAAAEQRRKGGHNFRAFMKRQTAATQKAPGAAEQQQMDRNLLSVDPHPKGQSTYMITLPNSKRYLSAIWGRDKSFFQIKNLIGVDVKFKREQNQLLIYAEADRCHTLLLTNKEQLKLLLVLTHRGLKVARSRRG